MMNAKFVCVLFKRPRKTTKNAVKKKQNAAPWKLKKLNCSKKPKKPANAQEKSMPKIFVAANSKNWNASRKKTASRRKHQTNNAKNKNVSLPRTAPQPRRLPTHTPPPAAHARRPPTTKNLQPAIVIAPKRLENLAATPQTKPRQQIHLNVAADVWDA